jgi:hypothetical protein
MKNPKTFEKKAHSKHKNAEYIIRSLEVIFSEILK